MYYTHGLAILVLFAENFQGLNIKSSVWGQPKHVLKLPSIMAIGWMQMKQYLLGVEAYFGMKLAEMKVYGLVMVYLICYAVEIKCQKVCLKKF